MYSRFIGLHWIVRRVILGVVFYVIFAVDIGCFPKSDFTVSLMLVSLGGLYLAIGLGRPTLIFIRLLLKVMIILHCWVNR
jgi:hypothetical protein